jgi:serine protease Do
LVLIGGLAGWSVTPFLHGQARAPLTVPKELTSYREVVKSVLPAVVSVETKTKALAQARPIVPHQRSFEGLLLPDPFQKLFDEFAVPNLPQRGFGSGFIVAPKGVILTNYHVVKGAEEVTVQLQDGRRFTSHDIKSDPKTDLALVRIDAKGSLPYLEWGNSDAMEIGDRVLAVGAPFGLRGSVTAGASLAAKAGTRT